MSKTSSPENFTSRIFDVLPDETWFYPGHGDDSTIGEQKLHDGFRWSPAALAEAEAMLGLRNHT